MKLRYVTITGADDNVNPDELVQLSIQYPWVEWGILFSEKRMGGPRYPSREWMDDLRSVTKGVDVNLAAHLCGSTMGSFMESINDGKDVAPVFEPFGFDPLGFDPTDFWDDVFQRSQLNFNSKRSNINPEMIRGLTDWWMDTVCGCFITQHNKNNAWIADEISSFLNQYQNIRPHHVLHDTSGGRGTFLGDDMPPPVAGTLTGYAGGLGPHNVEDVLLQLETMMPLGYTWIDMESGVRDDNNALCMDKVKSVLDTVQRVGEGRSWF